MPKLRMMTIAIPPTFGTSLFWFAHNQPHSGWLRANREWEQSFRWRGGWGRILRERKNTLGYVAKKSGTRPLQSFACFFLFRDSLLFRLIRFFFFFFRSRIKLGGYHHNAVMFSPQNPQVCSSVAAFHFIVQSLFSIRGIWYASFFGFIFLKGIAEVSSGVSIGGWPYFRNVPCLLSDRLFFASFPNLLLIFKFCLFHIIF